LFTEKHPGTASSSAVTEEPADQEEADAEKHLGDVIKTAPAYTPEA